MRSKSATNQDTACQFKHVPRKDGGMPSPSAPPSCESASSASNSREAFVLDADVVAFRPRAVAAATPSASLWSPWRSRSSSSPSSLCAPRKPLAALRAAKSSCANACCASSWSCSSKSKDRFRSSLASLIVVSFCGWPSSGARQSVDWMRSSASRVGLRLEGTFDEESGRGASRPSLLAPWTVVQHCDLPCLLLLPNEEDGKNCEMLQMVYPLGHLGHARVSLGLKTLYEYVEFVSLFVTHLEIVHFFVSTFSI